jgi:hypothetical protein
MEIAGAVITPETGTGKPIEILDEMLLQHYAEKM